MTKAETIAQALLEDDGVKDYLMQQMPLGVKCPDCGTDLSQDGAVRQHLISSEFEDDEAPCVFGHFHWAAGLKRPHFELDRTPRLTEPAISSWMECVKCGMDVTNMQYDG